MSLPQLQHEPVRHRYYLVMSLPQLQHEPVQHRYYLAMSLPQLQHEPVQHRYYLVMSLPLLQHVQLQPLNLPDEPWHYPIFRWPEPMYHYPICLLKPFVRQLYTKSWQMFPSHQSFRPRIHPNFQLLLPTQLQHPPHVLFRLLSLRHLHRRGHQLR